MFSVMKTAEPAFQPKTLTEAIRCFADPDVSLRTMVELRWPDGVRCPTCGSGEVRFISTRRLWECKHKHPRRQFSVKVGTIFEDSPLSLDKWMVCLYLADRQRQEWCLFLGTSPGDWGNAEDGVVHVNSHWPAPCLPADTSDAPLAGTVEADETFIGGKAKNMHKRERSLKIKGRWLRWARRLFSAYWNGTRRRRARRRASKVRVKVIPNNEEGHDPAGSPRNRCARLRCLHRQPSILRGDPGDEYIHEAVDHAEGGTCGARFTPTACGELWSLLKRCTINGTYVSVEAEHLTAYLDEQAFRFNARKGCRWRALPQGRFAGYGATDHL